MARYLEKAQHSKSQISAAKSAALDGSVSQSLHLQSKLMRLRAEREMLAVQVANHEVYRQVLRALIAGRSELTSVDRVLVRVMRRGLAKRAIFIGGGKSAVLPLLRQLHEDVMADRPSRHEGLQHMWPAVLTRPISVLIHMACAGSGRDREGDVEERGEDVDEGVEEVGVQKLQPHDEADSREIRTKEYDRANFHQAMLGGRQAVESMGLRVAGSIPGINPPAAAETKTGVDHFGVLGAVSRRSLKAFPVSFASDAVTVRVTAGGG